MMHCSFIWHIFKFTAYTVPVAEMLFDPVVSPVSHDTHAAVRFIITNNNNNNVAVAGKLQ